MKITVNRNTTLLDYVSNHLGTSKTKIRKLIKYDRITCEGQVIHRADDMVYEDDVIDINFEKDENDIRLVRPPFSILFEDKHVIGVLKPSGLLTTGDVPENIKTFHRIVRKYIRDNNRSNDDLYIVHRLDREVSGVMIFAKTEPAMQIIKDSWRQTTKLYYALVEGKPTHTDGVIRNWLLETSDYSVKSVPQNTPNAKYAITNYRTLQSFPNHTLLEIKIDTGRKNQIRVHMSEMGCPIVGDRRYGAEKKVLRQIRLHAHTLMFPHPFSKKMITLHSPIPPNFLILGNTDEQYK